MKRVIYYFLVVLCMTSCYDEDPVRAERGEPRYNLEDDPSDPVQHYIYDFYQKYRTIILTNPTIYDYKFNFSMKNRIEIIAPKQDKELLYKGLQFVEKVFIDVYTPEFKENFFPMSIIMADTIREAGFGSTAIQNSVSSTNFVAIGNIRENVVDKFTPEELVKIKAEINGNFWLSYLGKAKNVFEIDSAFYKVSLKDYGKWLSFYDGVEWEDIDFYSMGFISDDPEWHEIDPDDPYNNIIKAPDDALDLKQWMCFIFEKTSAEMHEICSKYPKMKQKYEILRAAMIKCSGFDISSLQ